MLKKKIQSFLQYKLCTTTKIVLFPAFQSCKLFLQTVGLFIVINKFNCHLYLVCNNYQYFNNTIYNPQLIHKIKTYCSGCQNMHKAIMLHKPKYIYCLIQKCQPIFKQSEFKAMKKYHISGWSDDRWIGLVRMEKIHTVRVLKETVYEYGMT